MSGPGSDFREVADRVLVHHTARLETDSFHAGPGTVINAHARVFGTEVRLGRECWIDEYATIGGGSAHDPGAYLHAGDWLHMGNFSQVNIARGVTCGDEVGLGIGTRIFTHGAYLSEWDGFPVTFAPVRLGSQVWLPNAQVNPGVTIGDDVVVAAGSVVTRDLPTGSFAGGVPARVLRPTGAPSHLSPEDRARVLAGIATEVAELTGARPVVDPAAGTLHIGETRFDLDERRITGTADPTSEVARNQLRRHGIRFRYDVVDGTYVPWTQTPAST